MITHQIRKNGQHRVLASDGRWRMTHHRIRPSENLHRPGDRVIDLRPGRFSRHMQALARAIRGAATAMTLSMIPSIRRAAKAAADFQEAMLRAQKANVESKAREQ